jgi:ParB family chromosome partitioning protein
VCYRPDFIHTAIAAIDVIDQTYVLGPEENVEPESELVESIRQFGVLRPPIIRSGKNGCLIVSGRKRVLAARRITTLEKLPCLMIPPEAPELYVYTLLLEESLSGTRMSLIQQADFFRRILQFSHVEDALPLLAKLGHKPQRFILDGLLSLLSLGKDALAAVHKGEILQKTARKMLHMDEADQKVLVLLIHSLKMGSSKQQKLVEYCNELIMRTGLPLSTLLHDFIPAAEPGKNLNIPQQAAALLSRLHDTCYPRTAAAELEFKQFVAKFGLPETMRLDHSPSFENDEVILTVSFEDKNSLQQTLPEIAQILQKDMDKN